MLLYFARDIGRILKAWLGGLFVAARRSADYRMGWYVIIGKLPIGVFGLLFKDEIRTTERITIRKYEYGQLLAHVLGYVGAINADELKEYQNTEKPYEEDDEIGKSGIER